MKKRKNGPPNQPVEKPMDAAEAAQILRKRAGLLRQIGPDLLEDNARTRQFIQALEMGARALLTEAAWKHSKEITSNKPEKKIAELRVFEGMINGKLVLRCRWRYEGDHCYYTDLEADEAEWFLQARKNLAGVDALDPERADGGDGQRAERAAHHRG